MHIILDELRLGKWSVLNNGKLIDRIQWVSFASGSKFIDFSSGALDIIDKELAIGFVDSFGDDDIGSAFIDVIISVIVDLSYKSGLLDEAWACALNISDIHIMMAIVEVGARVIGDGAEIHALVVIVTVLQVHIIKQF